MIVQHMLCCGCLFAWRRTTPWTVCTYAVSVFIPRSLGFPLIEQLVSMPEYSTFLSSLCQYNAPGLEKFFSRVACCFLLILAEHMSLNNVTNVVFGLLEEGCICVLYFSHCVRAKTSGSSQTAPEQSFGQGSNTEYSKAQDPFPSSPHQRSLLLGRSSGLVG